MITLPAGALRNAHVCYMVTTPGEARPLWIGALPLDALATLADARRNSEFARLVTPDTPVTVTVLAGCFSEHDAALEKALAIAARDPHCNAAGHTLPPTTRNVRTGKVRDIDTGEEFDNAAALARVLGVTPQSVGQHLAGAMPSVAGRRFMRVTP
jgi:hypothetical protein